MNGLRAEQTEQEPSDVRTSWEIRFDDPSQEPDDEDIRNEMTEDAVEKRRNQPNRRRDNEKERDHSDEHPGSGDRREFDRTGIRARTAAKNGRLAEVHEDGKRNDGRRDRRSRDIRTKQVLGRQATANSDQAKRTLWIGFTPYILAFVDRKATLSELMTMFLSPGKRLAIREFVQSPEDQHLVGTRKTLSEGTSPDRPLPIDAIQRFDVAGL